MIFQDTDLKRKKTPFAFLKFCLVGLMNTGVDFSVFTLLTFWSVPIFTAQTLSYSAGVLNSFFMNRTWTFKQAYHTKGQFIRFLMLNLVTLVITYELLIEFHEHWNWPLLLSKFVATGLSLVINFAGNHLWVFSKSK
ncbi:GtrA family protein [Desulfitobacterium sp. AusDCA]|uniref:GtrA family protein n=1 Tax=Desulfitobacterium sp. AusDCA TaxID=3240383 RepID=UPI003DA76AF0